MFDAQNKRQKIKLVILISSILILGVVLIILYQQGRLGFKADQPVGGALINQANLSYTDSMGNPREIQSNVVKLTAGSTTNSIVSGSIKDKNGNPFPRVTVKICKWTQNNFLGSCLKAVNNKLTDDNGNYNIDETLEEGAYTIVFAPYEYETTYGGMFRDLHSLYIYPDQSYVYNLTIREWPVVDVGVSYDGWKKQFNSPRMLSDVSCALKDRGNTVIEKITDEDGHFKIYSEDNVPDGTYSVECAKDSYTTNFGTAAQPSIKTYTVTVSGNKYDWVKVSMTDDIPDPARINVSVLDGSGQPIKNARVKITSNRTNQSNTWSISSKTTSQNIIPMSRRAGLPSGNYTITAFARNGYISSEQSITLSSNETKDLSFTLQPSAKITGTIKSTESDPIFKSGRYPLIIELLNSDGTQVLKTYRKLFTTSDGYSYKFSSDIAPATYKIRASAGYHMNRTEDVVISSSSDKPVVDLTLSPGCAFGGSVKDVLGEAVTFAKVELLDSGDNSLAEFITGKVGLSLYSFWSPDEYEFARDIDTGSYKIKVSAYGYKPQTQSVSCSALGEKVENINFILGAAPKEASNLAPVESTTSSGKNVETEILRETKDIDSLDQSSSDDDVQLLTTEFDTEGNIVEDQETGSYLYTEGSVVNKKQQRPIDKAKVTLIDNGEIIASTNTNTDGYYRLTSDKIETNKNYTLRVEKKGSNVSEQEISLTDDNNKYDIELQRQNILQRAWEWIKNLFTNKK